MCSQDVLDEIEAIEAIYPECLSRLNDGLIELKVPNHEDFRLRVSFPKEYPETDSPHILQVQSSGHDDQYLESLFNDVMHSVYHPGSVCVFDFLTELDGVLGTDAGDGEDDGGNHSHVDAEPVEIDALSGWTMSEPVTDRGSTFIAFAREVHSENDVFHYLQTLKTDRKISRASHNMVAYRIQNDNGTRISDCDDDGETAAGGRMLHLLTIMDVWNVLVVVSRWFGGTHIGPDRFKHINSTTREAVMRAGFVKEDSKHHKGKKKK